MWVLLLLSFGTGTFDGPLVAHDLLVANKVVCERVRDAILAKASPRAGLQVYCIPRSPQYTWEPQAGKWESHTEQPTK